VKPLTPTTVGNSGHFGLVNQYTDTIAQRPLGAVYAQPLAVSGVSVSNCPHSWPCDVIYVATENDVLYAFDATSSNMFWKTDLAAVVGGTFVDCTPTPPPYPCAQNHDLTYPNIGVTGTPVIDKAAAILYVVTLVDAPVNNPSGPIQNGATELYNSSRASGIGYPAIFTTPTIFKGRVYVGTRTEVDVFGTCSQCH